jgi:hypothetical protein
MNWKQETEAFVSREQRLEEEEEEEEATFGHNRNMIGHNPNRGPPPLLPPSLLAPQTNKGDTFQSLLQLSVLAQAFYSDVRNQVLGKK